MAGFFPHTTFTTGFTALPMTTMATVLDDIYNDITNAGGSINGWSVFDDQRTAPADTGSCYALPVITMARTTSSNSFVCTSGSPNGSIGGGFSGNKGLYQIWIPGTTQITQGAGAGTAIANTGVTGPFTPGPWTWNNANWLTVNTFTNDYQFVMSGNWPTATISIGQLGNSVMEKSAGYLVLRCIGSYRTFYVAVIRANSYGWPLRVQVWDTWNATTHVGTNPGNQEALQVYDLAAQSGVSNFSSASQYQYILFLLPDVFAIWAAGSPTNAFGNNKSTFWYAGLLSPIRATDTTALWSGGTQQVVSNMGFHASGTLDVLPPAVPGATGYANSGITTGGTSQIYKSLFTGNIWRMNPYSTGSGVNYAYHDPSVQVGWAPRGSWYLQSNLRATLDEGGKLQMVDSEVFEVPNGSYAGQPAKRGTVKWLRVPSANPSGYGLYTFGPCDDGHTYMMLRADKPYNYASIGTITTDDSVLNTIDSSAFTVGSGGTSWGQNNEFSYYSNGTYSLRCRYFLMPIDI